MSGTIMDTYAVVDKSKKVKNKKKVSPDPPVQNPALDMYAAVDITKKSKNQAESSAQSSLAQNSGLDNLYSAVDMTKKTKPPPASMPDNTYNTASSDNLIYYNTLSGATDDTALYDSAAAPTYSQLDGTRIQASPSNLPILAAQQNNKLDDSRVVKCPEKKTSSLPKCILAGLIILIVTVIAAVLAVIVAFVFIEDVRSDILALKTNVSNSSSSPTNGLSNNDKGLLILEANITSLSNLVNTFMTETSNQLKSFQKSLQSNITMLFSFEEDLNSSVSILFDNVELTKNNVKSLKNNISHQFTNYSKTMQENLDIVRSDIYTELKDAVNAAQQQENDLTNELIDVIQTLHVFDSCLSVISLSLPFQSGMYKIKSSDGSNMEMCIVRSCNGTFGGWRRIAYTHITDTNMACPAGFRYLITTPSCIPTMTVPGCTSVTYNVHNTPYTCITGRIVARQRGNPDGFSDPEGNPRSTTDIDSNYVDGVSLTYGSSPRRHIWTFTATLDFANNPAECPRCDNNKASFVSDNLSCERQRQCSSGTVICNDPLWDGDQCIGNGTLYRQLSQPTSEDVEMRVCKDQEQSDEEFAITIIELYVR